MNTARKTKKRTSPPLPRGFTPTPEQLEVALKIVGAGLSSGMLSDVRDPTEPRAQVHAIGPGALATGHGLAGGGRTREGATAYSAFVEGVRELVGSETWKQVDVLDQSAWVQIKGRRGRIYVAKTRGVVSRIESTLSPEEVPDYPTPEGVVGASEPDRPNGNIRSWLWADMGLVAEAVKVIAGRNEPD